MSDIHSRESVRQRWTSYVLYWKNPRRTPITLEEFPPVLAMLSQGIVWLLPGSTFGVSNAYRLMGEIAPETAWGAVWTAWALVWLAAILSRREPPRRLMTIGGALALVSCGFLIFASNYLATWSYVLMTVAMTAAINYVRLGAADALLPHNVRK